MTYSSWFDPLSSLTSDQTDGSWPVLFHKGLYVACHVERSTKGKTFAPLSDLPYVPVTEKQTLETAFFRRLTTAYVDKDVRVSNRYQYKIQIIYTCGIRSVLSALKVDF